MPDPENVPHSAESGLPVPEAFSLPVVLCPSCEHGIDPHGTDPGGSCGVGAEDAVPCSCVWSPNDIAGWLLQRPQRCSGCPLSPVGYHDADTDPDLPQLLVEARKARPSATVDKYAQQIVDKCLEEAGWSSASLREHTAIKILVRLNATTVPSPGDQS